MYLRSFSSDICQEKLSVWKAAIYGKKRAVIRWKKTDERASLVQNILSCTASKMNSLIKTVLKFCTTNQLFVPRINKYAPLAPIVSLPSWYYAPQLD